MPFDEELSAMRAWADATDRVALEHFRVDVPYRMKDDGTPVTDADLQIEKILREQIGRRFPGDAVVGEEEGEAGTGSRRWIVDPIDGTKNFRRGIPVFATLIGLEEDGAIVAGLVSSPALRARWWAKRGGGAYRDGERIAVSGVSDVGLAEISSGGIGTVAHAGLEERFTALCKRAARHRAFGDFWGHMLVAQGSMDVMVEPEVNVWDLAALKIIVEEAGGRMTSIAGEDRIDAGNCVTSNGLLHEQVVDALSS